MDWLGTVTGISGTLIAIGGLAVTLIKTQGDRAVGVASVAEEERRDTIDAYDRLVNQLQEERDRSDSLIGEERRARIQQVAELAAKVAAVERELITEREHTANLVSHIWQRKPPPPPARPRPIEITA